MVFISYSSKDGELAAEIKTELEKAYYSCFLAHDDIAAALDWHKEIWKNLRECRAFVGLVTSEFNESAFCQQEVGAALALEKPRLLVKLGVPSPPGFAQRFQSVSRRSLLETLDSDSSFRMLRVASWIEGVVAAGSFGAANALYNRFHAEWNGMSDELKLHWLLAAAGNGEVAGGLRPTRKRRLYKTTTATIEARKSAPFFRRAFAELEPLLTDEWLVEHDVNGVLHDLDP
jgi:hypothetical protein